MNHLFAMPVRMFNCAMVAHRNASDLRSGRRTFAAKVARVFRSGETAQEFSKQFNHNLEVFLS